MPDIELTDRLIGHYTDVPEILEWCGPHCIGGVLEQWGYLPTYERWGYMHIAYVLDISYGLGYRMFWAQYRDGSQLVSGDKRPIALELLHKAREETNEHEVQTRGT